MEEDYNLTPRVLVLVLAIILLTIVSMIILVNIFYSPEPIKNLVFTGVIKNKINHRGSFYIIEVVSSNSIKLKHIGIDIGNLGNNISKGDSIRTFENSFNYITYNKDTINRYNEPFQIIYLHTKPNRLFKNLDVFENR